MARTTLPPQADEAQAPPESQTTASAPTSASALTMPGIAVIVRLITLVFLILTISLLASNSTTIVAYDTTLTTHFNDIYAYRYVLSTATIGLSYTFLHLLSSLQQIRAGGKSPMNQPLYELVGDKVVLALLATGVGAAFGATVDLKAKMDQLEDAVQLYLGINGFAPIVSKLDDFFNRAYFPAIFLLIAFLTSGVSSLLSSLALINNIQ